MLNHNKIEVHNKIFFRAVVTNSNDKTSNFSKMFTLILALSIVLKYSFANTSPSSNNFLTCL